MAGLLGHGSGGLSLDSGASVDNQSTGSFTFQSDASIISDGTTAFTNEGALTVSSGVTAAFIQPVFTQSSTGSTMVEGGHVCLQRRGYDQRSDHGGDGNGPRTRRVSPLWRMSLIPRQVLAEPGPWLWLATVMTEDGIYDLEGETQTTGGSTLTFNSDATITDLGSDLEIYYGSTVNIASGQSFSIASVLFSDGGGTLNGGGGSLTVTGSMTWGGGTVSGFSTLAIAAGASLTLGDRAAPTPRSWTGSPWITPGARRWRDCLAMVAAV